MRCNLALFCAALLLAAPPTPPAHAAAMPGGLVFSCTAVAVHDGDGVRCREGFAVRLAGIATREMNETCRRGHPCPDASGAAARDALVALLGGPRGAAPASTRADVAIRPVRLRCTYTGGTYHRVAAWCKTRGNLLRRSVDLSCAMVKGGTALIWPRYWKAKKCPE